VDTGPGPANAIEKDLFEPFVTDKPDGTGLGLYVAAQIAEDHQGSIEWRRDGGTTCFTVQVPVRQSD
jgi:nitrogen-specific signal transduction histidine kinase